MNSPGHHRQPSASFGQQFPDEPRLDFLAGPGRLAQKREAGLYRRIELETPDRDAPAHLAPTVPLDELIEDVLKCDAVQWIAGMVGR